MPTPKRKVSKRRRDQRSANKGIKPKAITACQTCGSPIAPHQACQDCGYYKGVKMLTTKNDRLNVRNKVRQERETQMAKGLAAAPADQQASGSESAE